MTAEGLNRELGGRKSGAGFIACCLAHEDKNPSLSIREVDGHVLVHCHAGCEQRAVVDALRARGLWEPEHKNDFQRSIETIYDYTDEDGNLLYQVVRFHGKRFAQRRPDGAGGWIWKKSDHQVLYHLREVLEAAIVFVCEGEKDCETLRSHGFLATTNAGGCNAAWLPEYTDTLRGKEVILIPDRDRPGKERVIRIARALLHKVAKLVILELEDGKDATEWFERGHSELEFIAQLEADGVKR